MTLPVGLSGLPSSASRCLERRRSGLRIRTAGWQMGSVRAVWALFAAAAHGAEPSSPPIFAPSVVYDGAVFHGLSGGVRRGSTYSGDLNLRLHVDPASVAGISDVHGYLDLLSVHGGRPSQFVGDAQGISNISAPASFGLYEAWVQKNAFGDALSVLAGLYDVSSEFYRLQTAGLFLNSSFGTGAEFGQSGVDGPSIFPHTAWGLRASFRPGNYVSLQTAVMNGVPFDRADGGHALRQRGDGVLLLAELSVVDRFRRGGAQRSSQRFRLGRNASEPAHDNKIAAGLWHYTTRLPDQSDQLPDGSPPMRHGSTGHYVIGESLLHAAASAHWRLSGFVQAGRGDAKVDRFGAYGGAGLTLSGLFHDAGDDELGVAVNGARNGSHYQRAQSLAGLSASHVERVVEISYLLPVTGRLAVQPDLQFIHRPNTDPMLKDAVAIQLRFELNF